MNETTESTELVPLVNKVTSEVLDNNGLQPILEEMAVKARSFKFDVETKKGREDIASLAYKISRSKTFIENKAKDHVAEMKAKIKPVDDMRIAASKYCDSLRDEIKAPLVKWEATEAERVGKIQKSLDAVKNLHVVPFGTTAEQLQIRIDKLKAPTTVDWMEFEEEYKQSRDLSLQLLEQQHKTRVQYEADQAELEERRKKDAEAAVSSEPAPEAKVEKAEETLTTSTEEGSISTETSTNRSWWKLTFSGSDGDLSDSTLEHIASLIKEGFTEGEILEEK